MVRDDFNIELVRAREAQELLPKQAGGSSIDWGNVKVGHVDTGVTQHPVFGFDQPGGPWVLLDHGKNLRESGKPPLDPLDYDGNPGHGTRTASIITGVAVAQDGQPPASEIGIAPRVPLVPVRAVDTVVLSTRELRIKVRDAIRHLTGAGCGVVSISLGFPFFLFGRDGGLGKEVDRAYGRGVIIVAAAGQIVDSVTYPGKYSRTICVAGVRPDRGRWPVAPYRVGEDMIDVWAPAQDVLRADSLALPGKLVVPPVEGADPGISTPSSLSGGSHAGKYGKGEGTSYATAHVAAAAAMWLRHRGAAIEAAYGTDRFKIVEAFRLLLKQTGRPLNGTTTVNGTGVLDCRGLLEADLPDPAKLLPKPPAEHQTQ